MATPHAELFSERSPAVVLLPVHVLVAYGVMNVGVSFLSTMFVVIYLKFATDRLGSRHSAPPSAPS